MNSMVLLSVLVVAQQPAPIAASDHVAAEQVAFEVNDIGPLTNEQLTEKYHGRRIAVAGELIQIGRDDERGSDYYTLRIRKKEGPKNAVVARVYFADPFNEEVVSARKRGKETPGFSVAVRGVCHGILLDDKGGGIVVLRMAEVEANASLRQSGTSGR